MSSFRIGCVFLASGISSRFQGNKLLADFNGVPLVEAVLRQFPTEYFNVNLVVTRYPQVAAIAAQYHFGVVENLEPGEDLAQTIRLGVEALPKGLDGCMFSVCDQPLLSPESVKKLVEAFQASPNSIAALSYQGHRGNPVIFPGDLLPSLKTLPARHGGNHVIQAHSERVLLVEAFHRRELMDVDYRSDLSALE